VALEKMPDLRPRLESGGEDELMGAIAQWCDLHPGDVCAERYERMATRRHPRKTFIFSDRPLLSSTIPGSGQMALECDQALVEQSSGWCTERLDRIERRIAAAIGIPEWEVSVSPSPSPRRWRPPEINVEVAGGSLVPLVELMPEIESAAARYAAMSMSIVVSLSEYCRVALSKDPGVQRIVRDILVACEAGR
jgi:hypothetical protein